MGTGNRKRNGGYMERNDAITGLEGYGDGGRK